MHLLISCLWEKKVEQQRIDKEFMCWRIHKESWAQKNWYCQTVVLEKTFESSWTASRSNQSILKEINTECALEGLMLKLKLQYFGHMMWRAETHWKKPWCWERLKAGGEEGDRGWDGWMASQIQWTWVWTNSRRIAWREGSLVYYSPWGHKEADNWVTEHNKTYIYNVYTHIHNHFAVYFKTIL